jgi:hypothetical protein
MMYYDDQLYVILVSLTKTKHLKIDSTVIGIIEIFIYVLFWRMLITHGLFVVIYYLIYILDSDLVPPLAHITNC